MYIKNNLKELIRLKAKEKQVKINEIDEELAEFVGVKVGAIKAYKKEAVTPSMEAGFRIAQYFNKSIESIFYMSDEPKTIKENFATTYQIREITGEVLERYNINNKFYVRNRDSVYNLTFEDPHKIENKETVFNELTRQFLNEKINVKIDI